MQKAGQDTEDLNQRSNSMTKEFHNKKKERFSHVSSGQRGLYHLGVNIVTWTTAKLQSVSCWSTPAACQRDAKHATGKNLFGPWTCLWPRESARFRTELTGQTQTSNLWPLPAFRSNNFCRKPCMMTQRWMLHVKSRRFAKTFSFKNSLPPRCRTRL